MDAIFNRSKEDLRSQHKEEELTNEEKEESAAHLKSLREAIVSTFKQQMRLRRRLMELDSHLLGLALDAERQHAAISHWEARFNRLYKPISLVGSRLSTQQSYRCVSSSWKDFNLLIQLLVIGITNVKICWHALH